jgi:ring-1,2-phenylacetyl-CoA epoxidase subunit PaaE
MNQFHTLRVKNVRRETQDCVSIAFEPENSEMSAFEFSAGQYLTLKATIEGEEVRRSYSLCSAPSDGELRVAVKRVEQGKFSTWANQELQEGDTLESMLPNGKFVLDIQPTSQRKFLAFAAGSGITPVLSQIQEVLRKEPGSEFTLFYVNRETNSIIFREKLQELKDEYLNRFRLFNIMTREPQDIALFNGRLDQAKCAAILSSQWVDATEMDAAFLCGPEDMIWGCKAALEEAGMASEKVKFELFTSSTAKTETAPKESVSPAVGAASEGNQLSIVLDGITTVVQVPESKSIIDAALDAGLDAPYSCLGGVCCTCRAKMTKGTAEMDVNYALEASETEAGFVLTCQAKLKGDGPFEVDYDQQ